MRYACPNGCATTTVRDGDGRPDCPTCGTQMEPTESGGREFTTQH